MSDDGVYLANTAYSSAHPVAWKWTAFEGLANNIFTSQGDVWSFGVLLAEVQGLGEVPFPGQDVSTFKEYLRGGGRMAEAPHWHETIFEIMQHCWKLEPGDRCVNVAYAFTHEEHEQLTQRIVSMTYVEVALFTFCGIS